MQLYESTLEQVRRLSPVYRAGLILRHSARFPILNEDDVFTAALTEEGITQAELLGRALGQIRTPGRILTSPVGRCRDTAAAIARGAGWAEPVRTDYHFSHPYIAPVWNALPICWGEDPIPDQIIEVVDLVLDRKEDLGVLDLFVTHDTIVASIAGYFLGLNFQYPAYWPEYLEGVLIWRDEFGVHFRWREDEQVIGAWPPTFAHQLKFDY